MNRLLALSFVCGLFATAGAQFQLLVTDTAAGSVGPGQWMGVRRYNIAGTGGAATIGNGIASNLLSDPAGLALTPSGELLVGNRHGNANPSSISRFVYNSGTDSWDPNGVVVGNGLFGTHGIGVSSNGDILATNVNGPVSRFQQTGTVINPNGTIGTGPSRDAFVSANNQWVYVTQGVSSNLLKYDLATGNIVGTFSIVGSASLHNGGWRGNDLYLAGFGSGTIHRISFDANGNVASSAAVLSTPNGIGVAFSPDGVEMFVSTHNSDRVLRYLDNGGSWQSNGFILTGVSNGDIQVVPEPASLVVLGLGLVAVLRRKR